MMCTASRSPDRTDEGPGACSSSCPRRSARSVTRCASSSPRRSSEEIRQTGRGGARAVQGPDRRGPADPQRRRARGAPLAGGARRPGLDRDPVPHLARGDGARVRADAARVQRRDDRAGHRAVRHRRAEEGVPARRRPTSTSSGRRASPSRTPGPTSPACAPPRSRTVTTGSSTGRRRGPRSASTATGSSPWSAPTRTPRSRPASRCCSSTWRARASRSARSS